MHFRRNSLLGYVSHSKNTNHIPPCYVSYFPWVVVEQFWWAAKAPEAMQPPQHDMQSTELVWSRSTSCRALHTTLQRTFCGQQCTWLLVSMHYSGYTCVHLCNAPCMSCSELDCLRQARLAIHPCIQHCHALICEISLVHHTAMHLLCLPGDLTALSRKPFI